MSKAMTICFSTLHTCLGNRAPRIMKMDCNATNPSTVDAARLTCCIKLEMLLNSGRSFTQEAQQIRILGMILRPGSSKAACGTSSCTCRIGCTLLASAVGRPGSFRQEARIVCTCPAWGARLECDIALVACQESWIWVGGSRIVQETQEPDILPAGKILLPARSDSE